MMTGALAPMVIRCPSRGLSQNCLSVATAKVKSAPAKYSTLDQYNLPFL